MSVTGAGLPEGARVSAAVRAARGAWHRAHPLACAGALLAGGGFLAQQWFIRTTPEQDWKSPGRVAQRVRSADVQLVGLVLFGIGHLMRPGAFPARSKEGVG